MRKSRFILLLALCLVTTAIALSGCSGDKTAESSKDTITVGIPQDLDDGLDPHIANAAGTKEILYNIYEGLVKYDSEGNLIDAVAAEHVISDDGLTYTFTLRDNVKFHDGSLLTAGDVIYSINRLAGADGGEPLVAAFSNVKEVKENEDGKIVISLNMPDTEFLAYLTQAIIKENETNPDLNVCGTGPYKFVSHVPQESIVLESFDDYYGEKAKIKNVILKICPNMDTVVMDLKGGTIDMYARITASQANELNDSNFNILEGTMNLVQALYLNNAVEPFNDERVRKALCYAIDPAEIMMFVSESKGTEIGSSMFPSFGKYFDAALNDTYNQDVNKAKELLSEAGYPDGFSFDITVPSNYQQHIDTAQVLVEEFKAIGVTANINLVEWDSWLSDVYTNREFQSTVIGVDASELTGRALLERFVSDNDKNFINFKSDNYDAAFNNAVNTADDDEKTIYYKECLSILSNEAANVYIEDLPTFVALRKDIAGYEFYPLYVQDFSKLYFNDSEN